LRGGGSGGASSLVDVDVGLLRGRGLVHGGEGLRDDEGLRAGGRIDAADRGGGDADGGVAVDRAAAGVVGRDPQLGELDRLDRLAGAQGGQAGVQVEGEGRVAVVHLLHRGADRVAGEELADRGVEGHPVAAGRVAVGGRAVGSLEVADGRERAAPRVAEQALVERREERGVGQRAAVVGEGSGCRRRSR
jgi:hypothetical protein